MNRIILTTPCIFCNGDNLQMPTAFHANFRIPKTHTTKDGVEVHYKDCSYCFDTRFRRRDEGIPYEERMRLQEAATLTAIDREMKAGRYTTSEDIDQKTSNIP